MGAGGHHGARPGRLPLSHESLPDTARRRHDGAIESRSQDYQRLRRALLDAEREALVELRRSGAISNEVWLRVGRDLDLEDQPLDI